MCVAVTPLGRSCVPDRTRPPAGRLLLVTGLVRGYGPASPSGGLLPGAADRGLCPGSVPRQGRAVVGVFVATLRLSARAMLHHRRRRTPGEESMGHGSRHRRPAPGSPARTYAGRSAGRADHFPQEERFSRRQVRRGHRRALARRRGHRGHGRRRRHRARPPRRCGLRQRGHVRLPGIPGREPGRRRPSSPRATRPSCTPAATCKFAVQGVPAGVTPKAHLLLSSDRNQPSAVELHAVADDRLERDVDDHAQRAGRRRHGRHREARPPGRRRSTST